MQPGSRWATAVRSGAQEEAAASLPGEGGGWSLRPARSAAGVSGNVGGRMGGEGRWGLSSSCFCSPGKLGLEATLRLGMGKKVWGFKEKGDKRKHKK